MYLFLEGGHKTSAKMVDLDTQAQLFSEIWGWRIRIGNLFSADFTPVPFQYMWTKMITNRGGIPSFGASYQSVLSNIRWLDNEKESPFIKQLQVAMNNDNIDSERLSIRLNLDMFENNPNESKFLMGRVTGTLTVFFFFFFYIHLKVMLIVSNCFPLLPFSYPLL